MRDLQFFTGPAVVFPIGVHLDDPFCALVGMMEGVFVHVSTMLTPRLVSSLHHRLPTLAFLLASLLLTFALSLSLSSPPWGRMALFLWGSWAFPAG